MDQFDDADTEWLLSRGLRFNYNVSRAETYAQRYQLLGCDIPKCTFSFLHEAIFSYGFLLLASNNPTSPKKMPKQPSKPFYNDPDPGPERIWKWSHETESRIGLSKEVEYQSERACGYVFWDGERLDRTGWLDNNWDDMVIEMVEEI